MAKYPDKSLLNAMNFIRLQMVELTTDFGNTVDNGQVTLQYIYRLQNRLEKILHETRAACSPPKRLPVITDFDTVKTIGKGQFGTVNLVCHKETGQKLAMKMIALGKMSDAHKAEVVLERDILTFADNPFIVSMFCTFETMTDLCIVMENAGGGDCKRLLNRGRLPVDLARLYVSETVLALEYIHSYGIIHGDLKPANMLISSTGHIKLADFGFSKIGPSNMTVDRKDWKKWARELHDGDAIGTPLYMAPEIWTRRGYGKPVDWWALGIILFNFLVGSTPFDSDSLFSLRAEVVEKNIEWSQVDVPTDAQDIITLLLTKTCENRLGTKGGASEVKARPFFQGLNWNNLLSQEVPRLEEEEENTAQSNTDDDHSIDESSISSDISSDEERPVRDSDFSRVAYRFKEAYGSVGHLSLRNMRSATEGKHTVEQGQWENQEQSCDTEILSIKILSQDEPQLEDSEKTTQSNTDDDHSIDESSMFSDISSDDEERPVPDSDFSRVAYRFKEKYCTQDYMPLLKLSPAIDGKHTVEQGQWENQEQSCDTETLSIKILSRDDPQLEDSGKTTQSNTDDDHSIDESSMSSDISSDDEERPVPDSDFSRVAYRFKEKYSTQDYMPLLKLPPAIEGKHTVEQRQSENQEQSCDAETLSIKMLSQDDPQLEDSEKTTQSNTDDDHSIDESSMSSDISSDDEERPVPDSDFSRFLNLIKKYSTQDYMPLLKLPPAIEGKHTVEQRQSENQEQSCDTKTLSIKMLSQDDPQLEDSEKTTQSNTDDDHSIDESSISSDISSDDEERPVPDSDFSRVAYRFKEAYGSVGHLSLRNMRSATEGKHTVEQGQWENQEQSCDTETLSIKMLSQEEPQLEDSEKTTQSNTDDDHSIDESSMSSDISSDDEERPVPDSDFSRVLNRIKEKIQDDLGGGTRNGKCFLRCPTEWRIRRKNPPEWRLFGSWRSNAKRS